MKKIIVLPKIMYDKHFKNIDLNQYSKTCFISILDCDNREEYDKYDNFLQVKMWDIESDIFENDLLKYEKPSDLELKKIVDFINLHAEKQSFVVHCSAGISRSGAVAWYIYNKFHTEIDKEQFRSDNQYINPNLYILQRLKELDYLE
jgi:predicted protein tyrosine phosphatase